MDVRPIEVQRAPARDVVVIGGSAGGYRSLRTILATLPADCPAAIFVVLHVSRELPSRAATLLQKHCLLPVQAAEDGGALQHGTVTLAPYDRHLLIGQRHVHLRRGPRENGFRPAIDPLFRSAVAHHGGRAIGVILSGMLDDGASGALALSRVMAPILIEHPDHAEFSPMPRAAAAQVATACCQPIDELARTLIRTIGTTGRERIDVPEDVRIELMVSTLDRTRTVALDMSGELTSLGCPDCDAALCEIDDGGPTRYRCRNGHGYTTEVLADTRMRAVERTLSRVLGAQRRHERMLRDMASSTRDERHRSWLEQRADDYDEDALFIESLLPPREPDGASAPAVGAETDPAHDRHAPRPHAESPTDKRDSTG